jgi:hypothetical protein
LPGERDATEHTIAIEPVGIATQVFVLHRITTIADIFTTCELRRDVAFI